MKRSNFLSLLGILLPLALLFAMPAQTHASTKATFFGPIVPAVCHCDNQKIDGTNTPITTAPDYGCALQVIQNLINFGITLSTIIFTLYLVLTGISFITSGGSSEARSKAKTRFMNVFIGLAVLLCAWLVVDYVMKVVYNDKGYFGPWNAILASDTTEASRCIIARQPTAISAGSIATGLKGLADTATNVTPGTASQTSGGSCTAIPDSNLVAIDRSGHKLTADAAQRFTAMKAAAAKAGITLNVSSAYRSPDQQTQAWTNNGCNLVNGKTVCQTRTAAVPCSLGGNGSNHTRGTAVDITLSSGVYAWLKQNGGQFGFYNNLPNDLPHWSDTGR